MGIRILIAGLIAGIFFFLCSAAFHVATPLGHAGYKQLPSEESVLANLKQSVTADGLYFFPGIDMSTTPSPEQQKEWEAKAAAGPTGLLIYHPAGGSMMGAKTLMIELASNIAACLLAAFIAIRISGFVSRWLVVSLLGPISWLSINASLWNWYGFPRDYSVANFVMETACWILAGFVIAAIARPPRAAPASTDSTGTYEMAV